MKTITLCADDYGIHPAASAAIIELAEKNVIHATSCLTTMKNWPQAAQQLKSLKGRIDIGLHLNFTEGNGLSTSWLDGLPGLNSMLIKSHARLLDKNALIEEITAQYQMFIEAFDQEPDFIDGHQHVHHLPMVREALLIALRRFNPPAHFWIRSVSPMIKEGGGIKRFVIEGSGAKRLKQQLAENDLPINSDFAGIYSLSPEQPFRPLMQSWLAQLSDNGLIMCHPAKTTTDSLAHVAARQVEFNYLLSGEFQEDCQQAGVQLGQLRPTSH